MTRGSGFYPIAEYVLVASQPSEAELRDTKLWATWCEANVRLTKWPSNLKVAAEYYDEGA